MISLTQLITECLFSVVSITRVLNRFLSFWVLKWQFLPKILKPLGSSTRVFTVFLRLFRYIVRIFRNASEVI